MGNRISKVYTRTGDKGTTGISGNMRLSKNDPLIQAIGEVDELNSDIGVIVAFSDDDDINQQLQGVQHDLFNLGGMLSYPQFDGFAAARVEALEALIDQYNEELPPLKEFILPGGTQAAAMAQKARAVCRRVERRLVSLNQYYQDTDVEFESVSDAQLTGASKYVNRLSDLLFIVGRLLNKRAGSGEIMWSSHRTTDVS
ncbi:MAG: ATP:cob(I)alamin adenosyltransferase [Proteobacteria bacterium]|nr:MAG: ATP:cob(I)alamin adenosyltransferase [Pseudomonadota bacterium]